MGGLILNLEKKLLTLAVKAIESAPELKSAFDGQR
jgi:hypothetical protein